MQYAARLPRRPSTRNLVALLIALIVGAGVATGAYALIDNNNSDVQSTTKYIVVEQPAQGSATIPGKNEAATAAAIAGTQSSTVSSGPNEAVTASAISTSDDSGTQFRGSKASSTGSSSSSSSDTSSTATRFSGHR
jgi:hypothetical protein